MEQRGEEAGILEDAEQAEPDDNREDQIPLMMRLFEQASGLKAEEGVRKQEQKTGDSPVGVEKAGKNKEDDIFPPSGRY